LKDIVNSLESPTLASEIESLWLEYEEGAGALAQVAKQLDKFEMIVQADEYERANPGKDLEEFFKSTEGYFTHPEVCCRSMRRLKPIHFDDLIIQLSIVQTID